MDAFPAAPRRGFDHHGEAQPRGLRNGGSVLDGIGPRENGHARRGDAPPRPRFVPAQGEGLGRGADEGDAGFGAGFGKGRILGQKSVARVHRIGAPAAGRFDERIEPLMRRAVALGVKFTCKTGHRHPRLDTRLANYGNLLSEMGKGQTEIENACAELMRPLSDNPSS